MFRDGSCNSNDLVRLIELLIFKANDVVRTCTEMKKDFVLDTIFFKYSMNSISHGHERGFKCHDEFFR